MNTKNQRSALHERLNELNNNNQYSTLIVKEGTECFRVQQTCDQNGEPFKEGFHFWAPQYDLGRYNDPNGRLKVCYVATKPSLALAEAFGRRKKRDLEKPESFYIGSSDLNRNSLATNVTTKKFRLLDIGSTLSKLGMTTDQIASEGYELTQDVVRFFSDLDHIPIDGIAYRSRHHDDGGYCYALFKNSDDYSSLRTKSIETIEDFESSTDLPDGWQDSKIDGEEILTETLGFKVVPE